MTLYKVADTTKKILIVVVAIIAVLLVVRIVVSIVESLSNTLITEFSVETRGFGDLPSLTLSQIAGAEAAAPTFSIETLSGKLPDNGTLFNVYRITQPNRTLSSETFASSAAATLGFTVQPDKISAIEWEWRQNGKVLNFNIQNQHFTYTNSYFPTTVFEKTVEDPESVLADLLEGLDYSVPEDAEYTVEYLVRQGDDYIPTQNFLAPYVRISMITNLNYNSGSTGKVASATYLPSPVYVIVQNTDDVEYENVVEFGYSLWSVDQENKQTYSGDSVEEAYQRLQQGGGALVWAAHARQEYIPNVSALSSVRVTDVQIGYYSPSAYVTYLQPIYIFYAASGDQESRIDLVYYVPAL